MQSSSLYLGTAKLHRLKYCRWGNPPSTAHRQLNIQQFGFLFLWRVFVGHRPSRHLGGFSQGLPLSKAIQLYYRSINIIGQFSSGSANSVNSPHNLAGSVTHLIIVNYLDALLLHKFIGLSMTGKLPALNPLQVKDKHGQLPVLNHLAIQLPQGSCCAVPRIGKLLQPQQLLTSINLGKSLPTHINLAPNFKIRQWLLELFLDILNNLGIICNILTLNNAITSGNSLSKNAIPIAQGQGQSINFFLYHKLWLIQLLYGRGHKLLYLLTRKNILQGKHRHIMSHQYTSLTAGIAPYHLSRGIFGNQLRIICFQLFQL